ncbi:MAG: molecular chaperone TorD family protein [Acidobacteria bacterium]|nr:molecular chaperone TorD family protein [Acidobacteriota bacterium]
MVATRPDAVDDALARSVVYRFLSVGLQPPTGGELHKATSDPFTGAIAALRHLDRQAGGSLAAVAARLGALPPPAIEAVSEAFVRLFGHTARGLICACETEYGAHNTFHQPQELADLAGYYLAFGLRPATASGIRVDHIACECEFMDFLNRKEAVLLAADEMGPAEGEERSGAEGSPRATSLAGCRGPRHSREERSGAEGSPRATSLAGCRGPRHSREETLDVTTRAARNFLRDHLARFGRAFATRLASEDPDGYFGALGHVLLAFLNAECTRLAIEAGPADLVLRPEIADDAPMVCGSAGSMACGRADDLIQIQR